MSVNGNGTAPSALVSAIHDVQRQWADELANHGIVLRSDALAHEFECWILPARFSGSEAVRRSWVLEEFVRKLENRLEEASGNLVSVLLEE